MYPDAFRDLTRLRNYASGLQQLLGDLQQAAPARSRGADRSGAVTATLGPDGLPEAIHVAADWKQKLRPESLAAAVVAACEAATRERGQEWARKLKRSGWQQRVDQLDADSAAVLTADSETVTAPSPGAVPPAFRRPAVTESQTRSREELAEEAIALLDAALKQRARAHEQTRFGEWANADGTLTVRVSPEGQVSCYAESSWVAERSGARLTEALSKAVASARRNLADSLSAAELAGADLVARQQRLLADIEALQDHETSL